MNIPNVSLLLVKRKFVVYPKINVGAIKSHANTSIKVIAAAKATNPYQISGQGVVTWVANTRNLLLNGFNQFYAPLNMGDINASEGLTLVLNQNKGNVVIDSVQETVARSNKGKIRFSNNLKTVADDNSGEIIGRVKKNELAELNHNKGLIRAPGNHGKINARGNLKEQDFEFNFGEIDASENSGLQHLRGSSPNLINKNNNTGTQILTRA